MYDITGVCVAHVGVVPTNEYRLVQVVVRIACRSELKHEDLVTVEEFDEIANDK